VGGVDKPKLWRGEFFITYFCWGYIVAFNKVLTLYHSWIHSLHHSPLLPLSPFLEQYKSHFSIFIHEYIIFTSCSPFYTPFLTLPTNSNPHIETVLTFLFCFQKKRHCCLCTIATQRVSLWHFHVYTYYHLNCFIICFSPFYFSPLFMVISTGLKILYSFLYRKYINLIHLLNFLLLCSFTSLWPLLACPVFPSACICIGST
jgi:hypothetical protein